MDFLKKNMIDCYWGRIWSILSKETWSLLSEGGHDHFFLKGHNRSFLWEDTICSQRGRRISSSTGVESDVATDPNILTTAASRVYAVILRTPFAVPSSDTMQKAAASEVLSKCVPPQNSTLSWSHSGFSAAQTRMSDYCECAEYLFVEYRFVL